MTHERIRRMIENGGFTIRQIAADANRSRDAVKAIKRNLRNFGSTTLPARRSGRRSSITSEIRDALLAHLDKHPELYLEEMGTHTYGTSSESESRNPASVEHCVPQDDQKRRLGTGPKSKFRISSTPTYTRSLASVPGILYLWTSPVVTEELAPGERRGLHEG